MSHRLADPRGLFLLTRPDSPWPLLHDSGAERPMRHTRAASSLRPNTMGLRAHRLDASNDLTWQRSTGWPRPEFVQLPVEHRMGRLESSQKTVAPGLE